MKKTLLLAAVVFCSTIVYADSFMPVIGESSTYSNAFAAFRSPGRIFPKVVNGQKYMEVMRGGIWHQIDFKTPIKAEDNYSYSFDLVRKDKTSSFAVIICKDLRAPGIGSIFVNASGTVMLFNAKAQWQQSNIVLAPEKEYKITVSVFNSAKIYKVAVDGVGEFEIASVYRDGADKMVFAPQAPDKNINYVRELKLKLNEDAAEVPSIAVYAPVWGDKASYNNDFANMATGFRGVISNINGKKYMQIMRGGIWHRIDFKKPLQSDEQYSYSFSLIRKEANSSFAALVCADLKAPGIGSVFVRGDGKVCLLNTKGQWTASNITLEAGKEYKIKVVVSNANKNYKVIVDGVGEFEIASVYRENSNKMVFAPQAPEKNINYIGDFKFYCNK